MKCAYQCYEIGGPWIAENPLCPVHGHSAHLEHTHRDRAKTELHQKIADAQGLEELQAVLHDIVEML